VSGFWDANALRVEDAGVSAETMLAAVDEFFAGSAHRKIDVEDEATGEAARPFFAARGWLNERHAVMRRTGAPPPVHHPVLEVPVPETRSLRARWSTDYSGTYEEHLRFAEAQEPVLARRGMRAFMVAELGFTLLATGEGGVEIDGLYVTEKARGRGLGASLVGAALRATRADVAWIVADDEGQARPLYDRLGFETVWRPYCFVRRPS
jgi:ribosomal protein S18 acetylase RimI-like enzyme